MACVLRYMGRMVDKYRQYRPIVDRTETKVCTQFVVQIFAY